MNNIENLIYLVEGIHDSSVIRFEWNSTDKILVIGIDDLYCNFEGTEEYVGNYRCVFFNF